MTSSTSSSASRRSRAARCAAVALGLAALAGCRHAPAASLRLHVAVLPVQNATGRTAPTRALTEALDLALAARGVRTVPRPDLEAVLARHRIRWTGGVDRATARALREELGVDTVLVPTLEQHGPEAPPRVSIAWRLVSTGVRPFVLWGDVVSRAGDDAPGLLGLGLMTTVEEVERAVVGAVAAGVERWVASGAAGGETCRPSARFGPRRRFRAPGLDDVGRRVVAVLPFRNDSARRSADTVLHGQFVAHLARSGSFDVLDPGVVREELLAHRIILESGVSVDHAMALVELLEADLVVSGFVQVFEPKGGERRPPTVEFSSYVLDGKSGELVWSSSSTGDGEDGVLFFGAGRVHTTSSLSCRMVRGVVDGIVGDRGAAPRSDPRSVSMPHPRPRSRHRAALGVLGG